MHSTTSPPPQRWIWIFALVYSVTMLGIGLWMSVATGDWLPLLCASALVVFPVGGIAMRARAPRKPQN